MSVRARSLVACASQPTPYGPTMYSLTLLLITIGGCLAAPVDEPVRVDLPVYDQPEAASDTQLAEPLEAENYGQPRSDKTLVGNLISHKLHTANNIINHKLNPHTVQAGTLNFQGAGGWFSAPVTTLEGALLETEGLGSKTLSVKDNLHHLVAGLFQPKPLLDTIREEEKYGNTGDKFYTAGRNIVGGAEGVSNLVNTVLEVPGSIIKKITRVASEKLNNIGGRLIGL